MGFKTFRSALYEYAGDIMQSMKRGFLASDGAKKGIN